MTSKVINKSILFRVDSSYEIGFGHFSRCLILAEELKKKYNIIFLYKELSLLHLKKIKDSNFNYFKINYKKLTKINSISKKDQIVDAEICYLKVKNKFEVHSVILDCYYLDHFWEKEIYRLAKKIIVIDDLANRKHFCDLLIDQNYHSNKINRYEKLLLKKTKILQGLKYVILSKEIRQNKFRFQKILKVKNILIFFGGTDIKNLTIKILEILIKNKIEKKYKFSIIITSSNKNIKFIIKICHIHKFKLIINTDKMGYYISKSDFILSTGGIFTWEKLFFNKPSMVIPSNINQISTLDNLDKKKCLRLFKYNKNLNNNFYQQFFNLINNIEVLNIYSQNTIGMIDGDGVKRIINNIL